MKSKRLLYPHGVCRYIPLAEGDSRDGLTVEASVTEMYSLLVNNDSSLRSKAFLMQLTEITASLLGGRLTDWVQQQYLNPNLHGNNFEFLVDTLNYIVTGVRSYPISNWERMVSVNPEPITLTRNVRDAVVVVKALDALGANYISQWLSQPSGIQDLITTLFMWFGDQAPETNKERYASYRPAMII